ncbi:putative signal transduction histidine kinase [Chthoniobacter flavus Ellin428]|uniref:Putative signal transduction histidine kinase n=2 Tax=Chthoniobacter flavus TaxID=191863 RepID=B4D017_9BACT|nr:putative signal transduction histidine kinase [Chthoniobacter flavus Ellin428]TCO94226.1 histidine kinase/DNA gyrase B/HSP90-like ATPase [Chthoniobacter flavus]
MLVDGRPVPIDTQRPMEIASSARRMLFAIGRSPDTHEASRVRYRLEGVDDRSHEGPGEMFLALRFLDPTLDQLQLVTFKATGESPGWNLTVEPSDEDPPQTPIHCEATLIHRREIVPVPSGASSFWVTISSAGPPATMGCLTIEGLSISRLPAKGDKPELLVRPVFSHDEPDAPPAGWVRDGLHRSMAQVVHFGAKPASEGLAVIDDDPFAHAEWHTSRDAAPKVQHGDRLLVEWNEAFSIGLADRVEIPYPVPGPGRYRFVATRVDPLGKPVGTETTLTLIVTAPVWQRPWFWVAGAGFAGLGVVMLNRAAGRRKIREHSRQLEQERTLQNERLRISRDLHDDLGARATHISLLSAMAEEHAASPEGARGSFAQISGLSRELIFALYQTVWAVNPENDHLEALTNHLCQLATKQCDAAHVRCRLEVAKLSHERPVASQLRHHVSMAFSEAMHNAIRHGKASEITTHIGIENEQLIISVRNDGQSFDPHTEGDGNGLRNMRQRIETIHGTMTVESSASQGTEVRFSVPLA